MHLPARGGPHSNRHVTKEEIRREMRSRTRAIAAERSEKSRAICRAITSHPAFAGGRFVAMFDPLPIEPDVSELLPAAAGRCCFPRVVNWGLEFAQVLARNDLTPVGWHPTIREPAAGARLVPPEEIGLILVPGLAFTRSGLRLGRGGGFYDRYLARLPASAVRIGVCFDGQLRETLPEEAHDQRVNAVATESGLISTLS